jgi:REP element-mobilizing transposase RayT
MNKIIQDCFPNRTYPRLIGYDYSSPGAYFVTVCAHQKQCLFGTIEKGIMHLNPHGKVVQKCWQDLQNHYAGINNEFFIVMPNHVHGIVVITNTNRRSGSKPDPTNKPTLSEIIRAFKTFSSRGINESRHSPGTTVWQRSFYEHIIRNEKNLREIGEYIAFNPAKWDNDSENPDSLKKCFGLVGSGFRRLEAVGTQLLS